MKIEWQKLLWLGWGLGVVVKLLFFAPMVSTVKMFIALQSCPLDFIFEPIDSSFFQGLFALR